MEELTKIKINGADFYFRDGTSDSLILSLALPGGKFEYSFPKHINPKVILDIGANIGVVSLDLAHRFPDAVIHAFEPEPKNFELLLLNVGTFPRIVCHNVALGSENSVVKLYKSTDPTNYGGYSCYPRRGVSSEVASEIRVREVSSYLKKLNIVDIDMIKIDAEGAEWDIISSIEPDLFSKVKWVEGELHGVNDFGVLRRLETMGFDLGYRKNIDSMVGNFIAGRKSYN